MIIMLSGHLSIPAGRTPPRLVPGTGQFRGPTIRTGRRLIRAMIDTVPQTSACCNRRHADLIRINDKALSRSDDRRDAARGLNGNVSGA